MEKNKNRIRIEEEKVLFYARCTVVFFKLSMCMNYECIIDL